ncbi:hypothetical protein K438DRAFT_1815936 [Mycena galopus ATCC 62051]|nr:hypothetical protein K438DRAFT_1815936 [Mycena galopus ATCC 62051]
MFSVALSRRNLLFLLCALITKLGCTLWLRQLAQSSAQRMYSYVGEDYPRTWPIPMTGPVLMPLENTRRCAPSPSPNTLV